VIDATVPARYRTACHTRIARIARIAPVRRLRHVFCHRNRILHERSPMPTPFHWSLILGTFMAVTGLFMLAGGHAAASALQHFPRSVWGGRLLAVLAWAGAGWAAWVMPLSILDPFKRFLPLVVLVCIPLSWYWLEDLLVCRALGGILMLFPGPLLMVTRSHPSPWRLVLVIIAYLAIIKGMVFMLYPWYVRRTCHAMARSPALRLTSGAASLLMGAGILVTGFLALR